MVCQKNSDPTAKKLYVIDTNVLLHDPHALLNFSGAHIGIPAVVLEELDHFKKDGAIRGRNAREAIRILDEFRQRGCLRDGVPMDGGGVLRVLFLDLVKPYALPFKSRIDDNDILTTAFAALHDGYRVIFISKDLNARIKADALGIEAQDYIKDDVSEEQFYRGWRVISVPAVQLSSSDIPDDLNVMAQEKQVVMNEFIMVQARHNPHHYKIFRFKGGKIFTLVVDPVFPWSLKARNAQQLMALNLLLDPAVQLVCLFGPAGTGKTFLALLTALYQVLMTEEYEKLLISRPVVPLGRDIGYLPGTMEEKLKSWMLPVYDNMHFIAHAARMTHHFKTIEGDQRYERRSSERDKKGYAKQREHRARTISLDDLMRADKLGLEAITYMRGRSIPFQFILIDEVQNLTPHEVKTIVSRVGEGSKMVLTGDPYQIDSPYLDFASNGLVTTSERFKGESIFGTVYLEHSERSQLAQLANQLL